MGKINDKEKKFKGKVKGKPGMEDERVKDSKYSKGKRSPGKFKEDKPYKMGPNDPLWRTSDKVMTKLVANLPFGLAAGLTQNTIVDDLASPILTSRFNQPGIIAVSAYITMGDSRNYNSAVNLAARKIYSFVRHANSGSRNYEAVDMAMFFGSMVQLIALAGFIQRALRTVKEYSTTNRYTPVLLIQGMGLNFEDLLANQPQLKYIIAWLGRVIKSLAIPDLPIFHAAYEAFQYIYVDNDSPKEQYYLITPTNLGIYDPVYNSDGGGIHLSTADKLPKPSSAISTRLTVAQLFTYIKARTDILLGDEDVGIIAGDILKAFPNATGLFDVAAWDLDYELFKHSPEILQQIHNCHVLTEEKLISVGGYKQDPGTTGTAPFVVSDIGGLPTLSNTTRRGLHATTVLDAFSRDPDPEEVVNCTILNPQYKIKSFGGNPETWGVDTDTLAFDLFLPTGIYIKKDLDSTTGYADLSEFFQHCGSQINTATMDAAVTNFDWHPLRWYLFYNGTYYRTLAYGDIQNIRLFDYDIGKRIHDNSILSLLAFQDVNFYSKG